MADSPGAPTGSPMDWEPDTSPIVFSQQYVPFYPLNAPPRALPQASMEFNPPRRRTFEEMADGTEPTDRQSEAAQSTPYASPRNLTQSLRNSRILQFVTIYFWSVINVAATGAGAMGTYIGSKRRRAEVPVTPRPRGSPYSLRRSRAALSGLNTALHNAFRRFSEPATLNTSTTHPQLHHPFNPAIPPVLQMPGAYPATPPSTQSLVPPGRLRNVPGGLTQIPSRVTSLPIQRDVALTSAQRRALSNPFTPDPLPCVPPGPVTQDAMAELNTITESIDRERREKISIKIRHTARSQGLAASSSKPAGILRKPYWKLRTTKSKLFPKEAISALSRFVTNAIRGDQGSPTSPETPTRPRRNVAFVESPRTGRPVTATKRYYIGESMDHPSPSSSRDESSMLSLRSNMSFHSDSHTSTSDNAAAEAQLLGECFPVNSYQTDELSSGAHPEVAMADADVSSGSSPAQAGETQESNSQPTDHTNDESAAPAHQETTMRDAEVSSDSFSPQASDIQGSSSQPTGRSNESAAPASLETTMADAEDASSSPLEQANDYQESSSRSSQQSSNEPAAPLDKESTLVDAGSPSPSSSTERNAPQGLDSMSAQYSTEKPATSPSSSSSSSSTPSDTEDTPTSNRNAVSDLSSTVPETQESNSSHEFSSPNTAIRSSTDSQPTSSTNAGQVRDAVPAEIRRSSPESINDSRNSSPPDNGNGSTHESSTTRDTTASGNSLPDTEIRRSSFESDKDSSRNSSSSATGNTSDPPRRTEDFGQQSELEQEGHEDVVLQDDIAAPQRRSGRHVQGQSKAPSKAPSRPKPTPKASSRPQSASRGPRTRSNARSTSPDLPTAVGGLVISPSNVVNKNDRWASKLAETRAVKEAEERARVAAAEAERRVRLRKEAEQKAHREGLRRMPKETLIQPLTAEANAAINEALGKGQRAQVAMTTTGNPITRRDIGKVLPQSGTSDDPSGWLNDEIISAYLQMVTAYGQSKAADNARDKPPKFHSFNAFFYTNLQSKGYEGVKRWAKKAKIGGKDLEAVEWVFIPVNKGGNHWTLAAVSPMRRLIEYFDSLHGASAQVVGNIKAWLRGELGSAYEEGEWVVREQAGYEGRGGGPTQDNAKDCGVFTATTAKMITLGVDPMAVVAADMPLQRRRMVAEMLNGGFSGAFEPRAEFEEWSV